jgi:hypothetical protein
MTIPTLSNARLGYSWLDNQPGKIRFEDNKMVLGVGTRAFTLADRVGFGIKQMYNIPLLIEVDKFVCLKSGGTSMNANNVCTTFGALAPSNMEVMVAGVKKYIIIGNGDYQIRQTDGTYIQYTKVGNPNNVDLFK